MNRRIRMRRFNDVTQTFDTIFPQTITENVLRRDDGGVLESYLNQYDRHLMFPVPHLNRALSQGTHRHLTAHIHQKKLVDHFPLLLTLHTELDFEPTLDLNHSGPKPIINGAGERIPGGQIPGAVLFMVYSAKMDSWIMLSNDNYSDLTRVMTPVEHRWYYEATSGGESLFVIPGFNRTTMKLREINYGQTVLIYKKDWEFDYTRKDTIRLVDFTLEAHDVIYFIWNSFVTTARKGHTKLDLVTKTQHILIKDDDTIFVNIPEAIDAAVTFEVIYGQTKLREGIDFHRNAAASQIELAFPLMKGDLLQVDTMVLEEAPGDALPNNWGSTGAYRYHVETSYGEYKAEEDKVSIIPVPNFNHRKDSLTLIRDNKVLVYDVDYTIDLLDQIVLLTQTLSTGDMIYWTILHGAMIDVPNFNVIKASGGNGQHILVDIGWNQICDFFALVIKLEYDLQTAPTIKCINGPARPIADCFGNPVMGGYKAGSFLWVIYNEEKGVWYSLGHSQMDLTSRYPVSVSTEGDNNFHGNVPDEAIYGDDHILERVIPHNLGYKPTKIDIYPTEPPGTDSKGKPKTIGDMWWYADETNLYVGNTGNATSAFHWSVSTTDKTSDITSYLESELANIKGKSEYINYELIAVEFEEDNVSFVEIGWWDWKKDSLMVNYNQTVLLEGVDYSRSETGITFIGRRFNKGDIIQYTHSV